MSIHMSIRMSIHIVAKEILRFNALTDQLHDGLLSAINGDNTANRLTHPLVEPPQSCLRRSKLLWPKWVWGNV